MSNNTAEPTQNGVPATPEQPSPQPQAPAQEPETDWKAESRKWEQRAKENSEAAKRLTEIEEASKTAEQKAAERLAELESKVIAYESEKQIATWKAEVSGSTGVPAAVLAGNTKEEIEAHAETLKPLIAEQAPAKPQPLIVPAEGKTPVALNSSALEEAMRKAVGAN